MLGTLKKRGVSENARPRRHRSPHKIRGERVTSLEYEWNVSRIISLQGIAKKIYQLRGHRVMLSPDLAELYDVEPRTLVQAVKRNLMRFPDDFMFQLTWEEQRNLRSQPVILEGSSTADRSQAHGKHTKYPPYAFTEQGVAMLSSVLRNTRAVEVNIEIMRAFVRLREILAGNRELARKLAELEKRYDAQFRVVFEAIREIMESSTPPRSRRRIGFGRTEDS